MRRRRSSYDGNVVVDVDDELAARAPIFSPFFPFLSFYSISSPRGGKKFQVAARASEHEKRKEKENDGAERERERGSERERARRRSRKKKRKRKSERERRRVERYPAGSAETGARGPVAILP